ncbi:MAG: hypothetical protein LW809_02920 [Vampirovibrionales bacterium]|jgi:hypothetical protein|nr:hypothetical protein [Vampirovibrionales bacterium]
MMTLSNINNSSASRVLNTFKKDPGAEKIVDEMKSNKNVDLDFVEDTKKDEKLTKLKLIQGDRVKDTKIEVVVNVDDIKRKAKENGVKEDVFLSQQIASVMSASYLMLDAIKDGKDPSKYLTNGEFLVASNLLADGMVRRTNKDAIPYLDKERASMAERIQEEHGDVETDSSDAFERAEALGFKGINTGGWGDKIVQGFGDLSDLDDLEQVAEVDDDDDEVSEVDDDDDDDYDYETEEVDNDDDDTVLASNDDTEDKEEKKGLNWGNLLLGAGGGFLLAKLMSPDKSVDVKKDAERKTQLALQQQQEQFQLILAQQQAQQQSVLAQQQAQADYQAKLAAYQAQVAAINTATTSPGTYTTTASTPVVYSTKSSSTTPTYTPPTYVIPTVPTSDWA